MRAHLQILKIWGCAVLGVREVVVERVILGHNNLNLDFLSVPSPHGNVIAQVNVSVAVKLISHSFKTELLRSEGFQHLRDMRYFIYGVITEHLLYTRVEHHTFYEPTQFLQHLTAGIAVKTPKK